MKFFFTLFLAVLCALQGSVVQAKPRLVLPPQTRDNWRSIRTNHLFVIGNADAEKLRQVAAWLEFFTPPSHVSSHAMCSTHPCPPP